MEAADLSPVDNTLFRIGDLDQHLVVRTTIRLTSTRDEERLNFLISNQLFRVQHFSVTVLTMEPKLEAHMAILIAIEAISSQKLLVTFASDRRKRALGTHTLSVQMYRPTMATAKELEHA